MSPQVTVPPGGNAPIHSAPRVSRLVVVAPNWLGDLVLALPALAALLLPNSFHAALVVWRAGIPERWGYRRDLRGALLTHGIPRPRRGQHQASYYTALIEALGGPAAPATAQLTVPPQALERAASLLRDRGWSGGPLCGFAPGAAYGPAKCWPPSRAGAVAAQLARIRGLAPVFVGAVGDRPGVSEAIASYRRIAAPGAPRPIDLAGATDLAAAAGVLAMCQVVVANDSGAMHLAAAVGAPVVGLFGPTNEHATSPLPHPAGPPHAIVAGEAWCRPCQLRACPLDHRCMRSIEVERVANAALSAAPARQDGRGR